MAKVKKGDDILGKVPPQSIDFEETVLGAILIDKESIFEVIEFLKADSFYKESNQIVYKAIITLFDATLPIDILTVIQQLRSTGELEKVGGAHYVSKLTSRVNSSANIEYHARIVLQHQLKRGLIEISGKTLNDAYDETNDVFDLMDAIEKSLYDLTNQSLGSEPKVISDNYDSNIEVLKNKCENPGISGIPSGINALDEITGGWQNSDLIIVAARPGMGKTAFAVKCLLNAAISEDKSVALFSLEMSESQVHDRITSSVAEVNGEAIRKANISNNEWDRIRDSRSEIINAKIFIDPTTSLKIREFRSKALKMKRKHDIDLIIVDYIQIMTSPEHSGFREQEIATISRNLKAVAKELNVPVIALSQLSRKVEERGGDKRPMLQDLRESGSIEQDADMVLFLYRPEYYGFTDVEGSHGETISTDGIAEAIIAKNRHGKLDTVPMKFIKNYAKFDNMVKASNQFPSVAPPPYFPSPEGEEDDKPF